MGSWVFLYSSVILVVIGVVLTVYGYVEERANAVRIGYQLEHCETNLASMRTLVGRQSVALRDCEDAAIDTKTKNVLRETQVPVDSDSDSPIAAPVIKRLREEGWVHDPE